MSGFTVRNNRKCKMVERKQLKSDSRSLRFQSHNHISFDEFNPSYSISLTWRHIYCHCRAVHSFHMSLDSLPNQCRCYHCLDCFWTKMPPLTDTQQISVKSVSFLDIYVHYK